MRDPDFLKTLTHQAKKQSRLSQTRLLPAELDGLTSLIGNYPWQTLVAVSFLLALGLTGLMFL